MRKILFVLLILLLCGLMYFVVWQDIPSLEIVKTYPEVEAEYGKYYTSLETLDTKNNQELPAVLSKLNTEYSPSDSDNVVKKYKDNKKYYEDLVALQKASSTIDSADIYDIEYIWTALGKHLKGIEMTMLVTKSEADLNSNDYVMCNLEFELVGRYANIAEFIDLVELDSSLGFQINDFFMEGYKKTARNQHKDSNMDTNNIPSATGVGTDENGEFTGLNYSSSADGGISAEGSTTDNHNLDVIASFKVYNIPLNRKNVTNIKSTSDNASLTTALDGEEESTEESE